jgi:hypothetical protein
MPLWQTVTSLDGAADVLRGRRYGRIDIADGRFRGIQLRPYAKLALGPEALLLGRWGHEHLPGDRLRLYYNQPWRFPNFLVLKYIASRAATSYASLLRALEVLDYLARLKRSDAILSDVANWRISDRLLARHGWEPHCPSRWHRHYIKRFYGQYPPAAAWLAKGVGR